MSMAISADNNRVFTAGGLADRTGLDLGRLFGDKIHRKNPLSFLIKKIQGCSHRGKGQKQDIQPGNEKQKSKPQMK